MDKDEELVALRNVEKAAREWTAARVQDGLWADRSVIPTAQRLLDELNKLDALRSKGNMQ